jgi:hypothetical protein
LHTSAGVRVGCGYTAARLALVAVLVASSVMKLATGYDAKSVDLPSSAYYGAAVIELVAVLGLLETGPRRQMLAAVIAGGLFSGGTLLALLAPNIRCGCLGSHAWDTGQVRSLVAAIGGCLCVVVVFANPTSRWKG